MKKEGNKVAKQEKSERKCSWKELQGDVEEAQKKKEE